MKIILSNIDCLLDGKQFPITQLKLFTSDQLASIVGVQHPNDYLEEAKDYQWSFKYLPMESLRFATEYGEEPESGWENLYLCFLAEDEAAAQSSKAYLGRDNWLKNQWIACTDTYPLFVVMEEGNYRVWDGHHRLAGAFYYDIEKVAVILGK